MPISPYEAILRDPRLRTIVEDLNLEANSHYLLRPVARFLAELALMHKEHDEDPAADRFDGEDDRYESHNRDFVSAVVILQKVLGSRDLILNPVPECWTIVSASGHNSLKVLNQTFATREAAIVAAFDAGLTGHTVAQVVV